MTSHETLDGRQIGDCIRPLLSGPIHRGPHGKGGQHDGKACVAEQDGPPKRSLKNDSRRR
jgi:hypothetical protein